MGHNQQTKKSDKNQRIDYLETFEINIRHVSSNRWDKKLNYAIQKKKHSNYLVLVRRAP
jgi:hypothetical protein